MSQGAAWNNALAAANTATKKKRKPAVSTEHPERVLLCLDLNNPLRKFCLKLVEWKYVDFCWECCFFFLINSLSFAFVFHERPFEYLILICILLNCVALGANTPYPNKDNDKTNEQLVSWIYFCNKIIHFISIIKIITGLSK